MRRVFHAALTVSCLAAGTSLAFGCPKSDAVAALAWPLKVFSARNVLYLEALDLAVLDVDRAWNGRVFGYELLFVAPGLVAGATNDCLGNETLSEAGPTLARLGPARRPTSTAFLLIPSVVGLAARAWA